MDPLTVVSLTSNIIQLVDAAISAATKCHEIYSLGAPKDDLQLAFVSEQLTQSFATLDNSLQVRHQPLPSGVDLASLSAECCESAKILTKELLALQKIPGQGRLRAAVSLFKRRLKAREIQSLKRRLEENQKTLNTKVMIDMRQMIIALFEEQNNQHTSVYQELTALATKLDFCHISAADSLKTFINSVVESNKQEHQATRIHFNSTVKALITSQAQKQEQTIKYERFIESLRFDDINVRENEVSQSHSDTFGWVFNDDTTYPWDNLKAWLEHGQSIYWINGKAGSGKSTFMKFLVDDERTSEALDIWSGNEHCTILKFYFWLSGTKFQRSMKGFLCSLLRQIVITNEMVLEDILQTHKTMMMKRSLGDWSLAELRNMSVFAINSVSRVENICIFIDGIDEFDQDEDVQQLLDLIEQLAELPRVKLCLSSRPEVHIERYLSQYPKLHLQDLTAEDMEICIMDRLDDMRERYPSIIINAEDIDEFLRLMTRKADGVFLWVYFALNSLLRGMRNEDDFEVLLERLDELPSGMEQLYQQMWRRLNGDEQRYRAEASLYFSYHEFFPCSLFEMMVALNPEIQTKYLQEMKSQDPTPLAEKCEILKTRILTRCAGLLEVPETVKIVEYYQDSSSASVSDSNESTTLSESVEEETAKEKQEARYNDEGKLPLPQSAETIDAQANASNILKRYHSLQIKFLHRTARDFLLDTETGNDIIGESSQTREARLSNITRARMATLVEGLDPFSARYVNGIMKTIGKFDTKDEIELLEALREVCVTLHVPGSSTCDITRFEFWGHSWWGDYLGRAVFHNCTKYVQWYIDHVVTYLSPYYLGYLFSLASFFSCKRYPKPWMQLVTSLADKGADLHTKHIIWNGYISTPFEKLLEMVLARQDWASFPEAATEVAQLIERLYPTAVKPEETFMLPRILQKSQGSFGIIRLIVEFEGSFLCRLALDHLRRSGGIVQNIDSVTISSSTPVKVLLVRTHDVDWLRTTTTDAVYLGQAYEKVLFPEDYNDAPAQSLETFTSRLEEVVPRCEKVDINQWEYEVGWRIVLPENTLTLDPSEDVDESNWKERGWFRTATTNPRHGSIFAVMDRDRE